MDPTTKQWLTIIGIAVLVAIALLIATRGSETFSSSGLTISDEYCHKLASIYLNPQQNYTDRVCGHIRRNTIDHKFGNYYTVNGILV